MSDYLVVETFKKNSNFATEFFVARPGWVEAGNKLVYYPRIGLKAELTNEYSQFASDWIPRILKKIWHTSMEYSEAEKMVDYHVENYSGASSAELSDRDTSRRSKKMLMPTPKTLPRLTQYTLSKPTTIITETWHETAPPPKRPKLDNQTQFSVNELEVDEVQEDFIDHEKLNVENETQQILNDEYANWVACSSIPDVRTGLVNPEQQVAQQQQDMANIPIENDGVGVLIPIAEHNDLVGRLANIESVVSGLQIQINEFSGKIDGLAESISTIFGVTKNVDRFLTEYFKDRKSMESTAQSVQNAVEDFTDLEAMKPLKTTNELVDFEMLLSDKIFYERFIRFLRSKYNFASLKGKTLYGLILRQLIAPDLLIHYSWKGNSRKCETNIGFRTKHEIFIKFVTHIVRMADLDVSCSDVDEWFSNRLRQKNQISEREKNRITEPKLPTPRNRLPKQHMAPKIAEGNKENHTENDQITMPQQHQQTDGHDEN